MQITNINKEGVQYRAHVESEQTDESDSFVLSEKREVFTAACGES